MEKEKQIAFDRIREQWMALALTGQVREEIDRQIRRGAVDDHTSKELQQIRSRMITCEEQMKRKEEQVMHCGQKYMNDTFCTFRNGRVCVPVKKEYRYKYSCMVKKQAIENKR